MAQPLITCPTCGGTGKTHLQDVLLDTLEAMLRTEWLTTTEIFLTLGKAAIRNQTALNNRLDRLVKLGYVAKDYRGKNAVWKRIK